MKKILLIGLILSTGTVFAQTPSIRVSFEREYPRVNYNNVQWEQRNHQWHGTYRDNYNRNVEAYYDEYGNRIDTHTYWERNELPPRVQTRVVRRYPNEDYRVYRIERPAARPLFQITLGKRQPVYYNDRGRKRRYDDRH